MMRKWGLRALVGLGAVLGLFLIMAFALQVPAVGKTIGSPKACGTCHVMTYEVVTLERSSHRQLACLDCHSPSGFVEKPVEEMKSASRHMYVFLTGATPAVIKPTHQSREIIQQNCESCHGAIFGKTHIQKEISGRYCFECHRDVPHGRPLRN
jgi:cytochrome c nitrite reductase small subunit